MFEKRKRRKLANRHFDEAIASEWTRRGVVPRDSSGPAFRQAVADAGTAFPSRAYTEKSIAVLRSARESLSPQDRFIITGGREGSDPFAAKKA